jgi:hypothetical protein
MRSENRKSEGPSGFPTREIACNGVEVANIANSRHTPSGDVTLDFRGGTGHWNQLPVLHFVHDLLNLFRADSVDQIAEIFPFFGRQLRTLHRFAGGTLKH